MLFSSLGFSSSVNSGENDVPFLSPGISAYFAMSAKLVLPALLAVGLMTRFLALGLAVVNVVAVVSLADMSQAALDLHIIWGIILLNLLVFGAGKFSADALFDVYKNRADYY
jgi:putative oxidoreductase